MSHIVTVTLNPVIDKSTIVDKVVAGKKLRCSRPVFEPGGGGVNVARAITKLGGKATGVYFGGGYSGKFYRQLLTDEHIFSCPSLWCCLWHYCYHECRNCFV